MEQKLSVSLLCSEDMLECEIHMENGFPAVRNPLVTNASVNRATDVNTLEIEKAFSFQRYFKFPCDSAISLLYI